MCAGGIPLKPTDFTPETKKRTIVITHRDSALEIDQ